MDYGAGVDRPARRCLTGSKPRIGTKIGLNAFQILGEDWDLSCDVGLSRRRAMNRREPALPRGPAARRGPRVPENRAMVSLKRAPDIPGMTAEMTHATLLFADMRGYTGLAERLRPVHVV
jgi:hypothetical protein